MYSQSQYHIPVSSLPGMCALVPVNVMLVIYIILLTDIKQFKKKKNMMRKRERERQTDRQREIEDDKKEKKKRKKERKRKKN